MALDLTPMERKELVEKKATCPFLGSAIATGQLPVHNQPGNPLASIQDVRDLGNAGGGDLGKVLGFFAGGNHGKMRDPTGALEDSVPDGFFSLELPGSQGSHPGHSGILQGDPKKLDSGRFSPADFDRLSKMSRGGFIKRSDIGRFIAENIRRDPRSRSFPVAKWIDEVADLFGADSTEVQQSLASIAGSNHLLGSAGEFGLLLAFLHNSPRTRHDDEDDPAFSMDEIAAMFRDKRLPEDWRSWKKTAKDWVHHTFELAKDAIAELLKMRLVNLIPDRLRRRS